MKFYSSSGDYRVYRGPIFPSGRLLLIINRRHLYLILFLNIYEGQRVSSKSPNGRLYRWCHCENFRLLLPTVVCDVVSYCPTIFPILRISLWMTSSLELSMLLTQVIPHFFSLPRHSQVYILYLPFQSLFQHIDSLGKLN